MRNIGLKTTINTNGVEKSRGNDSPRHHSAAWRNTLKAVPTVARSIIDFFLSFNTPAAALVFVDDALDPVLVSVLAPA